MHNGRDQLAMRRARPGDLDGLYRLASSAGHGLTNLPPDRDRLAERIAASMAAPVDGGLPAMALFVLEAGDQVAGVAAVWPRIGAGRPFYSYRIDEHAAASAPYAVQVRTRTLTLTTEFTGEAEVGGLLIDPALRGLAAGRLAARARYLFIAEHRDAFPARVVAELRGWQDAAGASPVWEALGARFYGMAFPEADRLSTHDHDFIGELAPRHPVYLDLLPPAAQAAIGRPHDEGRGALKLLIEEGFEDLGHVDIFDAGPTVAAPIDRLKAVRDSVSEPVVAIEDAVESDHLASAGRGEAFRAARGGLRRVPGGAVVDRRLAAALQASVGDPIRHVAF